MKQTIKIIAIFLCVVLCLGIFAHFSGVFAPSIKINKSLKLPDTASPEFNGIMLSNYDSLQVSLYTDSICFTPESPISFANYDYLVIDLVDSKLYPNDIYTNKLHLNFSNIAPVDNRISLSQSFSFNNDSENSGFSGDGMFGTIDAFDAYPCIFDFSVIFDFTNSENVIKYYCFIDGSITNSGELDSSIFNSLYSLSYEYNGSLAEMYDHITFGGINIYAFETGVTCSLSNYFESGSLYDCKDSLLYGTN